MGPHDDEVVGVILAGGRGTRMAPFSDRYPKPILPVGNKPLMQYHLEIMKAGGVRRVFVVIGHLGYEISRRFGSGDPLGLEIRYVEQTRPLGIAHALAQLQSYVDAPFVLFLGDIFFRTSGMDELIGKFRSQERGSYVVVKEDVPEAIQKNFAVLLDPDTGRVRRVIEKPRYIHNRLKGCGLYLFDLPIFDAIRRTPRTAMRDEYEITEALQILIDDGEPVEAAKVVDEDINLTRPYDLLLCNLAELEARAEENLVAPSATVSPEATLHRTVVGPGARILGPVTLQECVVFEGATVGPAEGVIRRHVITPETAVECRPPIVR